jgi:alpha-L-arabinofuranosidase
MIGATNARNPNDMDEGTGMNRRTFLRSTSAIAASVAGLAATGVSERARAAQAVAADDDAKSASALVVNPAPKFEISPYMSMQFMEPLGATDAAVEAAWNYDADDWRKDFIDVTKDLAPDVVRFGGLLSRYYKWREGVGPAHKRPWYRNYVWGGKETHRVGTHEFVDFCRRVNAEPMYCVNFKSDGFKSYALRAEGNRTGDASEAADWVSYCNDPDNAERKSHGHAEPYNVKIWQLGNETNYGPGGFKRSEAIATTIEFAKAMRARDPKLKLIAWGDNNWAGEMARECGDLIDFVAFHMMNQQPIRKDTVLNGPEYQRAPERAWEELMELFTQRVEKKLLAIEADLDERGAQTPIAITEGHLSLHPHNANPILTEWLVGVYHARCMNLYARHGARVRMCTGADFNGMRWTVTAVVHQVPTGVSYLTPVGAVMRLFKRHKGTHGVAVTSAPPALDVAASRAGDGVVLHVANTDFSKSVEASLAVTGMIITAGTVHEIAPDDPRQYVNYRNPDVFKPKTHEIRPTDGTMFRWRFPARSVSAVELTCRT